MSFAIVRYSWSAALVVAVLCSAVASTPAAQARTQRVYIAIGDSVTASTVPKGGSFAPRLYTYLQRKSRGGANRFVRLTSLPRRAGHR